MRYQVLKYASSVFKLRKINVNSFIYDCVYCKCITLHKMYLKLNYVKL